MAFPHFPLVPPAGLLPSQQFLGLPRSTNHCSFSSSPGSQSSPTTTVESMSPHSKHKNTPPSKDVRDSNTNTSSKSASDRAMPGSAIPSTLPSTLPTTTMPAALPTTMPSLSHMPVAHLSVQQNLQLAAAAALMHQQQQQQQHQLHQHHQQHQQLLTSRHLESVPNKCCQTGRPLAINPHTGQTICSCGANSSPQIGRTGDSGMEGKDHPGTMCNTPPHAGKAPSESVNATPSSCSSTHGHRHPHHHHHPPPPHTAPILGGPPHSHGDAMAAYAKVMSSSASTSSSASILSSSPSSAANRMSGKVNQNMHGQALGGLPSTFDLGEGSDILRGLSAAALRHHAAAAKMPGQLTGVPGFGPAPPPPPGGVLSDQVPALANLPFYANGFSADPNMRRKNATRESTSVLKSWLGEHRKNPYPTKGEKIMLAIITKMTLTQVSTWFANARRRLKKDNRVTWLPRNRCGEDGDMDVEEDEADDESDCERTAPEFDEQDDRTGLLARMREQQQLHQHQQHQQQQHFGAVSGLLASAGHPLSQPSVSAHHLLEQHLRASAMVSQMGVASDLSIRRRSNDIDGQKEMFVDVSPSEITSPAVFPSSYRIPMSAVGTAASLLAPPTGLLTTPLDSSPSRRTTPPVVGATSSSKPKIWSVADFADKERTSPCENPTAASIAPTSAPTLPFPFPAAWLQQAEGLVGARAHHLAHQQHLATRERLASSSMTLRPPQIATVSSTQHHVTRESPSPADHTTNAITAIRSENVSPVLDLSPGSSVSSPLGKRRSASIGTSGSASDSGSDREPEIDTETAVKRLKVAMGQQRSAPLARC